VVPAAVVQTCLETPSYEQVMVDTAVPFCSGVRVAELVKFKVDPFEAALTVKSCAVPAVTLAEVGLIAIEVMTLNTVAVAVELKAWALTVMVAVPVATPVKMPVFGSTVATLAVSLDQETLFLI
jgi:hypothetical protein